MHDDSNMWDDLDELLEEIEYLLNALTDPDRKLSGKSKESSIERYEKFKTFRKAVMRLLVELEREIEEEKQD